MAALAACSSEQQVQQLRSELIGITEPALLACAGPPTDRNQYGALKELIYVSVVSRTVPIYTPRDTGPIPERGGGGYAYQSSCEAVFTVQQGRVTGIDLGTRREHSLGECAPILQRCSSN